MKLPGEDCNSAWPSILCVFLGPYGWVIVVVLAVCITAYKIVEAVI